MTLRVPRALARQIQQRARQRGLPASQVVREAIEAYLGSTTRDPADLWARVAPMVGTLRLDAAALERDAIARAVRAHNWRKQHVLDRRDVLLDTGPLVAVLDATDQWHAHAVNSWPSLVHRCVTTEAVVTEACHFVARGGAVAHAALDFLLAAEIPIVGLDTAGHRQAQTWMRRFSALPMDYADASLVVLGHALRTRTVFSTDARGFHAYPAPVGKGFEILPAARG